MGSYRDVAVPCDSDIRRYIITAVGAPEHDWMMVVRYYVCDANAILGATPILGIFRSNFSP